MILTWKNINQNLEMRYLFVKKNYSSFFMPYDYNSIMHYPSNAFAISPEKPSIFSRKIR